MWLSTIFLTGWSDIMYRNDFFYTSTITAIIFFNLLVFNKYHLASDIFGGTIGVLAWLSVFEVISEQVCLGAALAYYFIDLGCCLKDQDYFFSFHHVVTLSLISTRPLTPLLTNSTLMSYILTIDLINPCLAHWKREPTSLKRYAILLVSYFLLRICFLSWLLFFSSHVKKFYDDSYITISILFGCRGLLLSMIHWFYYFVRDDSQAVILIKRTTAHDC